MSIDDATKAIKAFEKQELDREIKIEDLAIGHRFDLQFLKDFIAAEENHPKSKDIDSIRVYIARSKRKDQTKEFYDLIMIPVLKDGNDIHTIYQRDDKSLELDTIIGNSLPCPNVCPNGFFC